jgi:DNA invertase Pin-like site-specific DNA recombinase
MKPIVAHYRVSTQKQARSRKKGLGLGLEAQREALERFAQANGLQIVTEFTEIETGKGAEALELRPQLASALNMARKRNARSRSQSSIGFPEMSISSAGSWRIAYRSLSPS